ncbi:MAG: TolC family protein [Nitrospirae bacterium]|nr:TolC family protein [Nitrospirota bacterium]
MHRLIVLMFAMMTLSGARNASAEVEGRLTLSDLIQRALERSEFIPSLRARVDQDRFSAVQAGAWTNPTGGLSSGLVQESGTGPLFEVSVSQPIFYPGKQRLRREIGELGAEENGVRLVELELAVTRDVVRLAYEYVIAQRKRAINESRQKSFDVIRSYLGGRLFPSPQQQAERRIVEARLRNIAADSLVIEGALRSVFESLNFYIGFEAGPPPELDIPRLRGTGSVDRRLWLARAMTRNTELSAQRVRLAAARKEKDLALLEAKPDFEPNVFFGDGTRGGGEREFGIGLALPIPVLNRNLAGIRSAQRKIEAEDRLRRHVERQIEAELGQLWSEYEIARQAVRLYPDSRLAELNAQIKEAEGEFRKGRVDLLTFLELDSEVVETNFRALDAQVALLEKFLDLLFLAGEKDVPPQLAAQ